MLQRLRDSDDQVLLFVRDLSVPFTNKEGERDVRPTKTQLKISGCHRSEITAKAWLRIRGYISTVAKHGDNIYDALRDAVTGNPWKPHLACRPEWLRPSSSSRWGSTGLGSLTL